MHGFTLYALFLIFFLAYARNPVKPLRVMAVLFAVAFAVRLAAAQNFWNPLSLLRVKWFSSKP